MKALVLMGGYGTRLRPLTLSVPKPLIPFCNKPILEHQIELLIKVNVNHVILAVGYQPESIEPILNELQKKFHLRITCLTEDKPLGTAGPIRLAKSLLMESFEGDKDDESFFVMNSDIMCEFPFDGMLQFHKQHSGLATILVTPVENPERFGVVVSNADGKVLQFVEKPKHACGNHVNAGLYLLRKKVIDMIKLKPTSIEKEVFPVLASENHLFSYPLEGFWMDLGKPQDFLKGTALFLNQPKNVKKYKLSPESLLTSYPHCTFLGENLIDPSVKLGNGCLIGPNVVIGAGSTIGDGVRLTNSVLMENVRVGNFSVVSGSILGWDSHIEEWVHILGLSIMGRDVTVNSECIINQAVVLPHQCVKSSILVADQIIM